MSPTRKLDLSRSSGRLLMAVAAAVLICTSATNATAVDIDCETINSDNITNGSANSNGYTTGLVDGSGDLYINTTQFVLPANGIICVRRMYCASSSRTLSFIRNAENTPVYLLVEEFVSLSTTCGVSVDGGAEGVRYQVGMDRVGGLGGPGGSDGGSCDFTFAATDRAGEGIGPGGGKAEAGESGGGGASPIENGSAGNSPGSPGGSSYSAFDHRFLHGGSGGGCGSNGAMTTPNGGGGGGGVLTLAAGQYVTLNNSSFLRARGGSATTWGGGGGGGVVRVIANTINGNNGSIDVRGNAGSTNCSNTSVRGGCGGDGAIKLEGLEVSGGFIGASHPQDGIFYGVQGEIFPASAQRPTLNVTSVNATFNGSPASVTPEQANPAAHVHSSSGVFLEAPGSPEQTITVTLTSNNVPHTSQVNVKMNTLGTPAETATATTTGTGSGQLTWTAQLTVPADMELGTIEAWITNVCTPGTTGCP